MEALNTQKGTIQAKSNSLQGECINALLKKEILKQTIQQLMSVSHNMKQKQLIRNKKAEANLQKVKRNLIR